jgi:superfamily II DNA or RNA helicase
MVKESIMGKTVVSITPIPHEGEVYNLHISDNHNYFADGINVSNCHLFKAKSLTSIMDKLTTAPYRIGTTGTLDGTHTHKLILEGVFGSVYNVTTAKKLMDVGKISKLKIIGMVLQYSDEECKLVKKMDYQQEMDFLVSHVKRNTIVRNLSITQKGNTLVLFQYIEKHGKIIYDMIKSKIGDTRKVFFVYGGVDTETREQIRALVEIETDAVIVASYGTFSTGINIKNLHNIIFASPSKSKVRNLQSIGRGLRKGADKDSCNLFDIGDDLTWKGKKNYTLEHMVERIKMYNEENFNYKLVKVSTNG